MPKLQPILSPIRGMRREYAVYRKGATRSESRCYNTSDRLLLTFDDFGTRENITGILDLLKKENVRAVFFLKGEWATKNGELVKLIADHGHWIGNHSYSHVRLDKLDDEQLHKELTSGPNTQLMRPPYGAYNDHVRQVAKQLGFRIGYWTVDSWDWKGLDASGIQNKVLAELHKGACILLHLNTAHALEALPGIIRGARERGYEFCHDGTEIVL